MAKTRLAPVSPKTIPELELMAMALGSQLGKFVQQTLHLPIVVDTTYYSDSQVCLAWLKSTKILKTFVRNRVHMIKHYKGIFFIPTDHNPADIATRISQPKESRQQLWWHGPSLWVLEKLKTLHQDVSEPLQYAASIPRKQELPAGKPEDTLETKTLPYTAKQGSPEDTLNRDHTQRIKRITGILGKPEDALYKDYLDLPELTEEMINPSGTFCNFTTPKFALSQETTVTVIDMARHSHMRKLIRNRAWINRFLTNLKQTPHSSNRSSLVPKETQPLTRTKNGRHSLL